MKPILISSHISFFVFCVYSTFNFVHTTLKLVPTNSNFLQLFNIVHINLKITEFFPLLKRHKLQQKAVVLYNVNIDKMKTKSV